MKYENLLTLRKTHPELADWYQDMFLKALKGKVSFDELSSVCAYSLDEALENLELQKREGYWK